MSVALRAIRSNCRKVVCIGRNYADHIKELNNTTPKQPFYFLKPPSSILLPNEGPILRPNGVNLHFEVELGLVIGKRIKDLNENDEEGAASAISSYLLAIDMTARNVQDEAKKKGLPWSIAKGFDTFLPISEPISASKVPGYKADLFLNVNGKVRQLDSTDLMLYRPTRLLGDISKVMTLEPGDIVLTGTPKGVGEVVDGDIITAGLKVNGEVLPESQIEVGVSSNTGLYSFKET